MAKSRKGLIFESKEIIQTSEIVRKSATKSRVAHYRLKKNNVDFIIDDAIDEATPILVNYFDDTNKIFVGKKAFPKSTKRNQRITFESNDDTLTEHIELNDIENGIEVVVTTTLEELNTGFPLKLDSVGLIKQNENSVSLIKNNKIVYRLDDFKVLSSTETELPVLLKLENESDEIALVQVTSSDKSIQSQNVTLSFKVVTTVDQAITRMYARNLNGATIYPSTSKYKVGRYADSSRVTKSNTNTLNIEINPEYIRDQVNLSKLSSFSLFLVLYHDEPIISSLAKKRTGYSISTKYTSSRKIIRTTSGKFEVDLKNDITQCILKNQWEPFTVSISSNDPNMYARLSGSQSGISDALTTDDYFHIYDLTASSERRPKLIFNYSDTQEIEKSTPFLEVDNGKSGKLSLNNFTNEFTFKHYHTTINSANLSIDLLHVFSSEFLRSVSGSNNTFGFGVGWKSNLHQWIFKTPYDPEKKELKVIYTDGFGVNHIFYEKWYYEKNNKKTYIDRNDVYLDELGELKYKIPYSNKIYPANYEVKSNDGLTLTTSAGMFGYRDKTKFSSITREYYDGTKKLDKSGNDVIIKAYRAPHYSNMSPTNDSLDWLNDNGRAVISTNFTNKLAGYIRKSSLTDSSVGYLTNIATPVFIKNEQYYTHLFRENLIFTTLNQYMGTKSSNSLSQNPETLNLTLQKSVNFDTTLNDYFETEEILQLKEQVKQYDKAIIEVKTNIEKTSENLENAILGLEGLKKSKARIHVSMNQVGITYQDDADKFTNDNAKISSYSIEGNIDQYDGQISQASGQITDLKESLSNLFTTIDEYELIRDNTNQKLQGLIKKQKLSPNDFITDESGNIFGFDYFGRLVLIADKFEKTIYISYKDNEDYGNKDLIDIVTTEHGQIRFNYDTSNLLKEIIDVDGKTTLFEYDPNKLLTAIKYDKFDQNDSKFAYKNEMLSHVIDASGLNLFVNYNLGKVDVKQTTTTETIDNKGLQKITGSSKRIIDTTLVKNDLTSTISNHINGAMASYEFDEKGRVLSSESVIGNETNYGYTRYNDHGNVTISSSYAEKHVLSKFVENNGVLTQTRVIHFSDEENQANAIWRGNILNSDTLIFYLDFKQVDELISSRIKIEVFYNDGQHTKKEITVYNNQKHVQVPVGVNKDTITKIVISATNETEFINFGLATGLGEYNTYDEDNNIIKNVSGLSVTTYLNYEEKQPTRIENIDKYHVKKFQDLSYNVKQQLTYSEDQDGNVEERYYKDSGELLENVTYNKKQATNKTVNTYEYDELGNVTQINGLLPNKEGKINPEKQTFYPGTKKLNYATAPNGLVTNYGFDFYNGNLLSMSATVDDVGNTTNYQYQHGLLTALSHQEFDIHYTYDGQGRKTAVDVACNNVVKFKYDDEYSIDGFRGSKTETEYYNHELVDNKITVIKDIYGKTREVTDSTGLNINYEYDEFDRLVSTTSAEESTSITYDYRNNVSYSDVDYLNFGKIAYQNTYNRKDLPDSVITKVSNPSELYHYQTRYIYDTLDRVVQTHINYNGTQGRSDEKLTHEYDAINRVIKERVHLKDINNTEEKYQLIANEYLYLKSDIEATNLIKKNVQTVLNDIKDVLNYDYDEMGNIIKIETDDNHITYEYDKLGRIVRENNQKLNLTKTFEYDESGNILRSKKYIYTTKELGIPLENNRYSYNQGKYQDQLVDFNNQEIIYDGLGRPTTYRDQALTWSPNSTLSKYNNFEYTYNNQGIRIKKVIGDTTHKYFVNGTTILLEEQTTNNVKKYLKYKYFGDKLLGFNYDNVDYYYIRNIQGDITSIINKGGIEVASYTYDAWGNHVVSNLTEDNIGDINPFRYRGYYYDKEIKLYYLNARYYDPETGRFISQDNISYLEPNTINGLNLYAYCENNPVMGYDPEGTWNWGNFWKIAGGVALIGALVVGTVVTGGALSVVLAGAAIGAIGGGIGAGISTVISGGDMTDFANSFLMGTITGAISGAVAASPLGVGLQVGINAGVGLTNYLGSSLLSGSNITLGGMIFNTALGAAMGFVGGNGWMKGNTGSTMFAALGAKNFMSTLVTIGAENAIRLAINTFFLGGITSGIYGRIAKEVNKEGKFFGL